MGPNQTPLSAPVPPAPEQPFTAAATLTSTAYLPASIGQRIANYVVDIVVALIIYFAYSIAVSVTSAGSPDAKALLSLGSWLVIPIYYLFFESIWQRTPVKWATGTKVVMADGSHPDFMHILGRSLLRLIPFEGLSFLANSHPNGWHDRWSGTLVVPANYEVQQVQAIDFSKRTRAPWWAWALVLLPIALAILGLLAAIVLASLAQAQLKAQLESQQIPTTQEQMPAGQAGVRGSPNQGNMGAPDDGTGQVQQPTQ